MLKTWCVGGHHYSDTINQNIYEKLIPRTKKLKKGFVVFVDEIIDIFLLSKWLKEKVFFKKGNCKYGQRSAISNSAWCDLKKSFAVLKLRYMCHSPKCNCQKQLTFSPRQFQMEGNGFKKTMKKDLKDF